MATKEEKKANAAKRQREFRARLEEQGLVSVTGFVPAHLAGELRDIMRILCENPDLEVGTFRNTKTGVFIGRLKAGKKMKVAA
jgi:hypothetical protein